MIEDANEVKISDRDSHEVPIHSGTRMVLRGECDWIIEGPKSWLDDIQAAIRPLGERLALNVLLVDFRNSIGFFKVPHLGTIEVVSGKWSQDHFDWMLQDLMEIMSTLPFTAGTGGALPYDRSVVTRKDVLYHAFIYLRYILSAGAPRHEQLLPALQLVLADPHSRSERLSRSTSFDRVRNVSISGLTKVLHDSGQMMRVKNEASKRLPLAKALRGFLPTNMTEIEVRSTMDTPENRFVLSFLRFATGIIDRMLTVAERDNSNLFVARIRHDCETMARSLAPIRQHGLWDVVGPMTHFPASSTVLHRKRGYRDAFRHFSKIRLASRIPLDDEQVRDLIEAKDIALLYELWSFFSVVRSIKSILGPPSRANTVQIGDLQVTVPREIEVSWKNGTRLLYNPHFPRSNKAIRHSYSVPLRPDIALEVPSGPNAGLHLFDAKFRLDQIGSMMSENEDEPDAEAAEERQGTFKRADLYKMHTYRDAISNAKTVWILYPGTEFRMFNSEGIVNASHSLPHGTLNGVGAIPLKPAESGRTGVDRVLQILLAGIT